MYIGVFSVSAKRRKRSKKWLKWVILLVLVIVAAVISYLVWDGYFKKPDSSGPMQNDKETITAKKTTESKSTEKAQPVREVTEKEKVVQYEGDDPNVSAGETGVLSGALTYNNVNNGQLVLRVNIDQYLNEGTCALTLSQNGVAVYTETVGITDAASTATCEGFNVPLTELSSGETNIVIMINSGEKSGKIKGSVTL